jgi:phosphatidylserine decarboxylase
MDGCDMLYENYADFFSREKKGIVFPSEPGVLGSPCEGLATVYADINVDGLISAKGEALTLAELLNDAELAQTFKGGSMLRIRITPANYHRAHFFDGGTVTESKLIKGSLHSVNPLAVNSVARLYCRNKRAMIMFSSQNFGDVVFVEVGATFVGSIVHCFFDGESVERGGQMSYFLPGGSLLLIFFKKDAFTPNKILLEQSDKGYETKIKIGEALGSNAGGLT